MKDTEKERLLEVKKFLKLDFNKSDDLKNIVELAAKLCEKPVALITLLDDKYNWIKVKYGTDIEVMPRETSFCKFGIQQDEILIIEDATLDQRFDENPLVHLNPNLRFYAGVPLKLKNGAKIGTICLFDQNPNSLSDLQQKTLTVFAKQATMMMELAMSKLELESQVQKTAAKNASLIKIAQLQSHQIRQPLTTLMGLINAVKEDDHSLNDEWLNLFEVATHNFDTTIRTIVAESIGSKDLRAIRFTNMVEDIEDYAVLILDEKGKIENWNKGAEKIKGYLSSEIIGRNFSVFYSKVDLKKKRPSQLLALAKREGVARDEGWRIRKDGTAFWGSIVITSIHDENNKVIGYTKVTKDLTTIKKAEHDRLLSADMYNLMSDYTSKIVRIGGWELDLTNNAVIWTSMTNEIHGVSQDFKPQLKTAINFYKKGVSRIQITNAVKQAIQKGTAWDLELSIMNKKGEEIRVRTTGKSDFKDGVCTKVYGIIHDLSQVK